MSTQIVEREIAGIIKQLQDLNMPSHAKKLASELDNANRQLPELVRIRDSWDLLMSLLGASCATQNSPLQEKPANINQVSDHQQMQGPYPPGAPIQQNVVDPWASRLEGMRCKSCIWFVPKPGEDGVVNLGRCRRHAPSMGGHPVVKVNDWCGDHRLNESWFANAPF